ncbi:MAG TPA: SH3 domain-containing protein, partial [Planctomycetaceae bacterium]|nr:SH3 domain-containing protein [Planctomycetaceae bacterium]
MRAIVIALMLVWSQTGFADSAAAQSRQFPYDALIADDDVYARSGPGQRYYPTSRFRKGEHVTVVRHDPGGWFMIEPPAGSFAWVRQEFVKRDGDR